MQHLKHKYIKIWFRLCKLYNLEIKHPIGYDKFGFVGFWTVYPSSGPSFFKLWKKITSSLITDDLKSIAKKFNIELSETDLMRIKEEYIKNRFIDSLTSVIEKNSNEKTCVEVLRYLISL